MKLCIHCLHARVPGDKAEFAKCGRTGTGGGRSPVTGELTPMEYSYCSTQRQYYQGLNNCGPEGKHFEAREVTA